MLQEDLLDLFGDIGSDMSGLCETTFRTVFAFCESSPEPDQLLELWCSFAEMHARINERDVLNGLHRAVGVVMYNKVLDYGRFPLHSSAQQGGT